MRIILLFFTIFYSFLAFGTLTSSAIFSLDTAGSSTGACIYDAGVTSPGTDYSAATTYHSNGSDLSSTNGTTNPCVVHSASHTFTSDENGNGIIITAGSNWTVQRAVITSISGGDATLDKACGSSATLSSGTWAVGKACALGNGTAGITDSTLFGLAQPGNKFWVKLGTYTLGSAISTPTAGSSTSPVVIEGFQTTRGDTPTGTNRPTITAGSNNTTFGAFWDIKNIIFTTTTANGLNFSSTGNNKLINSKVINSSTTAGRAAMLVQPNLLVHGSEIISYRGIGLSVTSTSNVVVEGSYIHDSDIGINDTTTAAGGISTYVNNVFSDNVTAAIKFTAASVASKLVYGNTFYGAENKLGIGISIATGSYNWRAVNNIFYGFTTGISHADSQSQSISVSNDFYNNTSNTSNWTLESTDLTLNPIFKSVAQVTGTNASTSSSTLTDSSANFSGVTDNVDFLTIISGGPTAGKYLITSHGSTSVTVDSSLGTTASGVTYQVTTGHNFAIGINLKAVGFPSSFDAVTNTYVDIGAAQRREPKPARIH